MKEKIVEYGTEHPVIVLSATEQLIVVRATDIYEGFMLMGHRVQDLPKKDDKGKIIFTRGGPKNGYWAWHPK